MLNEIKTGEKVSYTPTQDVKDYILKWYKALAEDKEIKEKSYRMLGNTNLTRFWKTCHDNYNVIVPIKAKGDWKRKVKRTITRDKANGFIAKLTKRTIVAQVLAQNKNQQVDNIVSKVLKVLLEYFDRKSKSKRIFRKSVKKAVVEGTFHVQQDVVGGHEVKTVIRNEEVFIPNFYQPDLQKQSHFIRSHVTSYEETKLIFGDNDNWKYVIAGDVSNWSIADDSLKTFDSGVDNDDQVIITYLWEHTGYDKKNKPKQKKFNVLINGIPMFDIDNKQNYKHNLYPITKGIFEDFADIDFYWGNSLPNKIREDQKFLDAWRTILLNKAVLNLGPPLFNKGNEHLDSDVIVPFKVTTTEMEEGDIFKVPGVGDAVTQGDWNVEQVVERSIDEGTQPPTSLGQNAPGGSKTLGEIRLKDFRASELLENFGAMMMEAVEDMAHQSLSNIIQFETKGNMLAKVDERNAKVMFQNQFEVPEQQLRSGETGALAINLTKQAEQPTTYEVRKEEQELAKRGIQKNIVHIDPSYLDELDNFSYVVANPVTQPSEAEEKQLAILKYKEVYFNNKNIDQKEATRTVVLANNDDEGRLLVDAPAPEQKPTQAPKQPSRAPVRPQVTAGMAPSL